MFASCSGSEQIDIKVSIVALVSKKQEAKRGGLVIKKIVFLFVPCLAYMTFCTCLCENLSQSIIKILLNDLVFVLTSGSMFATILLKLLRKCK